MDEMERTKIVRPLVFPAGTHATTKRVIAAVAWATNRRGRVAWKSDNVTRTVAQYLHEQNVEITSAQLSNAFTWLDRHGYVDRRFDLNRTRTLELRFHEDVILSGFTPEFTRRRTEIPRLLSLPLNTATVDDEVEAIERLRSVASAGTPVQFTEPPLPFAEEDAVANIYGWDDLKRVATTWWLRDPEGWSGWIDRVIERLDRAEEEQGAR